jgi:hypothetical protein
MGLTGGEVRVGGNGVGGSVGGTVVAEGGTVSVGGTMVGVEVAGMAVTGVLQPTRVRRIRDIRMGKMDFLIILSSSDQQQPGACTPLTLNYEIFELVCHPGYASNSPSS